MTPQQVISELLESDLNDSPNLLLLKKIILISSLGRLRVNGLPPDNKIQLADYLFDEEAIMFDFTRLSEEKRTQFINWFITPHNKDKELHNTSHFTLDERRGYTAEVQLRWWEIVKGWFLGDYSNYWKINEVQFSINYQLNGIDLYHGKQGMLISFAQLLVPPSRKKYKNPADPQIEPLGNTKRLILTNSLVDKLMEINLSHYNMSSLCNRPHPQSVTVHDEVARHRDMEAFRKTHQFYFKKPWYSRLWTWFKNLFRDEEEQQTSEPLIERCGFIKMDEDPTQISFAYLEKSLVNKDSLILFEDNLYYANKITKQVTHIVINETNKNEFDRIKNKFTEDYILATDEELDASLSIIKLAAERLFPETHGVNIYQRILSKEVIVTEKKPDIEEIVFCGGGARIFAHVGVWNALNEFHIKPKKFSGSSAGAIIALLCYLGYNADEMLEFFKHFKHDHLMHFDIDSQGLSDTHYLKTALDYIIAHKVSAIVKDRNIPYPEGKITFATLAKLKARFPDCGLGDELYVTSTQKRGRKTHYYSYSRSPDTEVSEAVKMSASLPLLYRPTIIDGEAYNDGGVLNNLPTEVFSDEGTTLLESADGNSLKLLAVQFDNGTERETIDRVNHPVYREGAVQNWIYKQLTGVHDPASGWEQDRIKLRKYAAQSVIIDVGDFSSTSFSVNPEGRQQMMNSGYQAAKEYLENRYGSCDGQSEMHNKELMYSSFTSLGDLLAYCCYRNDKEWFERVLNIIVHCDLPNKVALMEQSMALRSLYFSNRKSRLSLPDLEQNLDNEVAPENPNTFFGNPPIHQEISNLNGINARALLVLYPIFLELTSKLVREDNDIDSFNKGKRKICLHKPFEFLHDFKQLTGDVHIYLHLLIHLAEQFSANPSDEIHQKIVRLGELLSGTENLYHQKYYGIWNLAEHQVKRVWKLIESNEQSSLDSLLSKLRFRDEPMQIIEEGAYHEDFDHGSNEGDRPGFSA